MQGIEVTLAEVVDLGFLATDTGGKYVCFCFIKLVLTDMEQLELMKKKHSQ